MFFRDGLNYITEEMKKPERNLLRSMIVSIPTVTALYFLANISYFIVLSPDVIVASPSVAKVGLYVYFHKRIKLHYFSNWHILVET